MRLLALSIAIAMLSATCPTYAQPMEDLIKSAAASPEKRPLLLKKLMKAHVTIIASWTSVESKTITIQDFLRNGQSFIPFFSDQEHFKQETSGSGFEDKGVSIDANLFASILKGHETLILNPGSSLPIEFRASELKGLVDVSRLPK